MIVLNIAYEVKLTFALALGILLLFVGFIVFVVIIYNKNQINHLKENQIKEIEHQNSMLQKEIEKQRSLQAERKRISHDMHDEIGAGLSAIKLQSEILKMNIKKQTVTKEHIDELIYISEEINLSMREILWSLNSSNDGIRHVADYCENYMTNYFAKTEIGFECQIEMENPAAELSAEFRRNILLIVKEASHNIVKHSQATKVVLEISESDLLLEVRIVDNGVGIKSARKEGYGLSTMRSRAEKVGGVFDISTGSSGTDIRVKIPVHS